MDNKKLKILLVDDDDLIREMYAEVFKKTNTYEVLEAHDGVEGLDIATKEVPDVVFTGIVMPRMDGFALVEALKKTVMTANIPFVISSHMGREEDRKRAAELGAKEFVVKNMTTPAQVVEIVNSIFLEQGSQYKLDFSPFAFDAQKLAKDLALDPEFQCAKCGKKMLLSLKLLSAKDQKFETRLVCSGCGAFSE